MVLNTYLKHKINFYNKMVHSLIFNHTNNKYSQTKVLPTREELNPTFQIFKFNPCENPLLAK